LLRRDLENGQVADRQRRSERRIAPPGLSLDHRSHRDRIVGIRLAYTDIADSSANLVVFGDKGSARLLTEHYRVDNQ